MELRASVNKRNSVLIYYLWAFASNAMNLKWGPLKPSFYWTVV